MSVIEVKVPDIGDFKDVPVIGIEVSPGDTVKAEDPLITLESDKATLEVPSPVAGTVKEIKLKVGDKVSEGTLVLLLETETAGAAAISAAAEIPPAPLLQRGGLAPSSISPPFEKGGPGGISPEPIAPPAPVPLPPPGEMAAEVTGGESKPRAHASPSVRRFARELGVDVALVKGTGPKGRILQQDVQNYVKGALAQPRPAAPAGGGAGLELLPWPQVDFAKFGQVESKPLSRIKKISGANLARNWVMIPHVTQFDEADITDLEALRVQLNKENEKSGQKGEIRLTMLAFLIKAVVAALKKYPDFNASLDGREGELSLVYKKYFHIGFAADTPNGLVVPVIRDADKKGLLEIAKEMGALSAKAREGKLGPAEMQGGCFSISSLGGIGGTAFTPIVNAPEVAILGVSKSQMKPVWDGQTFQPRLTIPLSLSYDHRVIDGAAAARFTAYLAQVLADMRRVLL